MVASPKIVRFESRLRIGWYPHESTVGFPNIRLTIPKSQLFPQLKTLPEYLAKTGIRQCLFIKSSEGSFALSGTCRIDAWRLKMFTTLLEQWATHAPRQLI
jgi:hypothetical protein